MDKISNFPKTEHPKSKPVKVFEIIVVGTSLGGLDALKVLLLNLPANFPVPIAVVQHRHKDSDSTLAHLLQTYTVLKIKEPEDKEAIAPGCVYIAPADYHLLVEEGRFALSTEAPVIYSRPSIDVLFESAADAYAERVVGVILTGANHDGSWGLAKIKEKGGLTVVQEPEEAFATAMPQAALGSVAVDWILSLEKIASFLVQQCQPTLR